MLHSVSMCHEDTYCMDYEDSHAWRHIVGENLFILKNIIVNNLVHQSKKLMQFNENMIKPFI